MVHPPSNGHDMTPKRQKILDKAFAQLRKSRAAMDPKILSKIRRLVASSPEIMKKLGIKDDLKPAVSRKTKVDADMPLSSKPAVTKPVATEKPVERPPPKNVEKKREAPARDRGYEKIDQAKNMEVMAKLMALKPRDKEEIKKTIMKAVTK